MSGYYQLIRTSMLGQPVKAATASLLAVYRSILRPQGVKYPPTRLAPSSDWTRESPLNYFVP